MMERRPILEVKNLTRRFGNTTAVDNMNVGIYGNEIIGIVGNNGSGKTTFLKLMLDLLKPDKGCVLSKGINVYQSGHWKHYTSAYLDESFLIDYLTGYEYLHFLGKLRGLPDGDIVNSIDSFNQLLNSNIVTSNKLIRNLSSGSKHKIGIIGALLSKSEIVILDEPFNFLDPSSQQSLIKTLMEFSKREDATIVLSSHNLEFVSQICTRILIFENGKIVDDIHNDQETLLRLKGHFQVN
jgi:ABC-2 type transport system ATP-binding protein